MNAEMMRALEADGEKLTALTGEDHGPVFVADMEEIFQPVIEMARSYLAICPDRRGDSIAAIERAEAALAATTGEGGR